jgi:hypothetical protein
MFIVTIYIILICSDVHFELGLRVFHDMLCNFRLHVFHDMLYSVRPF